ncbi:molybdopterin-dependent oxidoreductase [Nocardia otitidiscaviarum]|uniref:molybdopterin-dependent oxidoreductase n=1 Tax=Nocardia otitidiscaviarum TaxID=1823 RepID=UPI00189419A9|nr:molybdopterin-dependent oxidoreductase [Nocardia otitidiscaviarum]MBF6182049.1 molybdopterin-dependent oxidoreductase [Nocardia otitidiscaviarum]
MASARKTACILCECNCGLEIEVEGRRLARIRGDKEHVASGGYTCEKALRLDYYQSYPHRLTRPLRRESDGSYTEIDWDTAVTEIAARLSAVRDTHGGDKIFFYGGGGQGNHLGGSYAQALQAAVGAKYYSNALAQEKTGEMWVDGKLYGGHTKGDFEHARVVVFVGKNPWQSHSFARARPVLRQIAADPDRTMIVIDPRRTETAELADIHLQVAPGTDAYCLGALLGVLVQEDLLDHDFLDAHTTGADAVLAQLKTVDVPEFSRRCGVDEELIRAAARAIGTGESVATYEDLGIQQAPHSTLSSYLNKLLWILTGNFGKPGTMALHSVLAAVAGSAAPPRTARTRPPSLLDRARKTLGTAATRAVPLGATTLSATLGALTALPAGAKLADTAAEKLVTAVAPMAGGLLGGAGGVSQPGGARRTPVTGARIIAGLVPCNSIAEEILTDHPDRFRAMWIDSVNPAHSLADSRTFRAALDALDLVVVVDVAFTETARHAHYVLPAASQFEKCEATFFNFEFPHNTFQLRAPLLPPLTGTLPEPEIYARLLTALDAVPQTTLARLRTAARAGRHAFALAFFSAVAADPTLMRLAPYVLYETLGPTLPAELRGAAVLWGIAHLCALGNPAGVGRAGYRGPGLAAGEQLFEAILHGRSGITFTVDEWSDTWSYVRRPDRRFTLEIPELLAAFGELADAPDRADPDYPFILAAGERRSFTANTIFRDPAWRRRDADGALRVNPEDARRLGVDTGDRVRVVTEAGAAPAVVEVTDTVRPGNITLPNGLGTDDDGRRAGVAPNELTSLRHRDPIAGTPWHKYVPARIEVLA